jgi:hypothetical protein
MTDLEGDASWDPETDYRDFREYGKGKSYESGWKSFTSTIIKENCLSYKQRKRKQLRWHDMRHRQDGGDPIRRKFCVLMFEKGAGD